ncbi:hypothetical protein CCUS01_15669 [Colletotrichum cuscutae]|uniref:Uncharacterized protein n=1 Tax=Colletotrichum cuscutae TaxID=1209917 RepID=A0AAI9Y5G3_9PEZI|nr:hypothetical protein CCUS01_15669 [Colletotrichum cuscutae]
MAIVPRQPISSYELPTGARSGFTKTRHDGLVLSHLAATPNLFYLLLSSSANHATRMDTSTGHVDRLVFPRPETLRFLVSRLVACHIHFLRKMARYSARPQLRPRPWPPNSKCAILISPMIGRDEEEHVRNHLSDTENLMQRGPITHWNDSDARSTAPNSLFAAIRLHLPPTGF